VNDPKEPTVPRVAVDVLLKREILDPQGRAVESALPGLGHAGATGVRVGRHIELEVDAEGDDLATRVDAMCAGFLTNPIIESYVWRVITDDERADKG
jgi:phosphoribosylformylglycinamidine synthase PurS subunit